MNEANIYLYMFIVQKSLKIPKGSSEFVNRRIDNKIAIRKRTKEQTTIYKTYS